MSIAANIIGRTKQSDPYDAYMTPDWAAEMAVNRFIKDGLLLKNQKTLEPCCGSGTTGEAAIKHKRNFIGIEIDSKYYAGAKKRIQQAYQLYKGENA